MYGKTRGFFFFPCRSFLICICLKNFPPPQYCWIKSEAQVMYSVVVPLAVVVACNSFMYIAVLRAISEKVGAKGGVKSAAMFFVLMVRKFVK